MNSSTIKNDNIIFHQFEQKQQRFHMNILQACKINNNNNNMFNIKITYPNLASNTTRKKAFCDI